MIAIGADHGAFALKEIIKKYLADKGYKVKDFGTYSPESVDYPQYAAYVAQAVASGTAERGILLCGTGIGMSIAANKHRGIRAALVCDPLSARLTREHNDSNILCLGARIIGEELAKEIVNVWLSTEFSGDERHSRRIDMLESGGLR